MISSLVFGLGLHRNFTKFTAIVISRAGFAIWRFEVCLVIVRTSRCADCDTVQRQILSSRLCIFMSPWHTRWESQLGMLRSRSFIARSALSPKFYDRLTQPSNSLAKFAWTLVETCPRILWRFNMGQKKCSNEFRWCTVHKESGRHKLVGAMDGTSEVGGSVTRHSNHRFLLRSTVVVSRVELISAWCVLAADIFVVHVCLRLLLFQEYVLLKDAEILAVIQQ